MSPLQAVDPGKRYGDTVAPEALNLAVDAGDGVCLLATPALMLQRGLIAAAGTDERRHAAFEAQAQAYPVDFRERTGRMMPVGERLDARRLPTLPAFAFSESTGATVGRAIRALLPALLLLLAFRRCARG